MKKIFYSIFLFLFCFFYQVNAQAFKFEEEHLVVAGPESSYEIVAYNTVTNLTGDNLNLRWVRTEDVLPSTWETQICDNVTCYLSHVSQSDFSIAANGSSNLDVHFVNNENPGSSEVSVLVYLIDEGIESGQTATFKASTWTVSTQPEGNRPKFSFYPNPVRDFININFPERGNHKIEIFNMLGNKIVEYEFSNQASARIPFMDEPKGMYLLTYKSETGRMITRTFSKE